MMPLGSWTRDLIVRVNHFSRWASTVRPPILFWLAAYTFPTGFLTAVLQVGSTSKNIPQTFFFFIGYSQSLRQKLFVEFLTSFYDWNCLGGAKNDVYRRRFIASKSGICNVLLPSDLSAANCHLF